MRQAIVAGVDYVDIEMDVAREVRRYGKTKRIISYHNLKQTPDDLLEIAQQAEEMDADVVKIAVRAHSVTDALRVLKVASQMETPTVAIAMGEAGTFTRVLNAKYGAPFTYANFNVERNFAPGHALLGRPEPRLLLRPGRRRDRGLRRDRRPDRPQPEPGRAQRRVPRAGPEQGPGADPDPGRLA